MNTGKDWQVKLPNEVKLKLAKASQLGHYLSVTLLRLTHPIKQ